LGRIDIERGSVNLKEYLSLFLSLSLSLSPRDPTSPTSPISPSGLRIRTPRYQRPASPSPQTSELSRQVTELKLLVQDLERRLKVQEGS